MNNAPQQHIPADALDGFTPDPKRRLAFGELKIRLPRHPYRVSMKSLAKDLGTDLNAIGFMLDRAAKQDAFIYEQIGKDVWVSLLPRHWERMQDDAQAYYNHAYHQTLNSGRSAALPSPGA